MSRYAHPSAGLVSLHQRETQKLHSVRFRLLGVGLRAFDVVSFLEDCSGRRYEPDWKHITKAEAE